MTTDTDDRHDHDHDGHEHHDHGRAGTVRHTDVAVIGGSAAGLAAAVQLARQQRSVMVIDSGTPRNAPAVHMHGYLGFDGAPPADLIASGRGEARRYGAEVLSGTVVDVANVSDSDGLSFRVDLAGGNQILARRVLVATGLADELPEIAGVAEAWGSEVIHCPFCHGYEARDRPVVMVVTVEAGTHGVPLWGHLASALTMVVHGGVTVADADRARFAAAGITIVDANAVALLRDGDGVLSGVELADGSTVPAEVVVVTPTVSARLDAVVGLGLEAAEHSMGVGSYLEVDRTGATAVPGVYGAGNLTDPSHQVIQAAGHGALIGAMIAFDLSTDTTGAGGERPTANQLDWDARYSRDQLWSGNPNGTLVDEVSGLAPGTALDIGAGEGGDAVWLAENGWEVCATDVSVAGLERVARASRERSLDIELLPVDANARNAFEGRTFDLVSAFYASVPRTGDDRCVRNVLAAVAPGGTLLVVSHDLESMRAPVDVTKQSRSFDPDAYVRVEDFRAAIVDDPGWEIVVDERRDRPAGSSTGHHHPHDLVFRARRLS